ncbi:MAG TPA: efflux RND transporter periplasmic adaptor subunit [Gemmataceae bacterium]|nr:efflux RND transporter periplasmic adaptor subunit [Gemmataceae bacterium]
MTEPHQTGERIEPAPDRARASGASNVEKIGSFRRLGRFGPTVLVLLLLAMLAFWGHRTGWTLPRFSSLQGAPAETDDWCTEHSVPESECVECRPSLLPREKQYGWCEKHGVHQCSLDHPEVAQLKHTPQITQAQIERAQRALDFAERPENNPKYKLYRRRIQFASRAAIRKAGVRLEMAWEGHVVEAITGNGEVSYDATRVASIATPTAGRVWRVLREQGDPVRRGDILALVDAAAVGKAKAEFLHAAAQANLKREVLTRFDSATGAVPERTQMEAQAGLREAQVRLLSAEQALLNLGLPIRGDEIKTLTPEQIARRIQFLGLPATLVNELGSTTTTSNLLPIKASLDGVVVQRQAVPGQVVDSSKTLFVVADPSRLWLTLHVKQEDLKPFRQQDPQLLLGGKTVRFHPDGTSRQIAGTITWVGTAADLRTRTLPVRAALVDPPRWLHANTFGSADIVLREEKQAVVVPNEAVQWDGNCHLVFVYDKHSPDKDALQVFHVRTVRPGASYGGRTEIIAGILKGEMVATQGSGVLKAELLKDSLGEG